MSKNKSLGDIESNINSSLESSVDSINLINRSKF